MKLLHRKFIGSSLVLVFGWLMFLGALANIANQKPGPHMGFLGGMYIIIGVSAYRSAKSRRLGLKATGTPRVVAEVVGIVAVIAHDIYLFHGSPAVVVEHPFVPTLPIWLLLAYLIAIRPPRKETPSEEE